MVHARIQVVAVTRRRSDKAKILITSRQIRQRNVRKQARGDRIEVRNCIVREGQVGRGIVDYDRLSCIRAGSVSSLRKVSLPLQQSRNGGKFVIGILSILAVEIDEEKSFRAAVINLWNVQRPANGSAEAILLICGIRRRFSVQRIRSSVQRRISNAVISRPVRMVYIKTAPPDDHPATTAAASAPAKSAPAAGSPKPPGAPNPPPCCRASLMRCSNSGPLIELNGFVVLPETAIDSVALLGSIPGTGIPEGTMSAIEAPESAFMLCIACKL